MRNKCQMFRRDPISVFPFSSLALVVLLLASDVHRISGRMRAEPETSCQAYVVRITNASGEGTLKLVCDGKCADGKPCEEKWVGTYDWKHHKRMLLRACYCEGELRQAPCCTTEDALSGFYLKDKCRIALVYPPEAQIGSDGQQSLVPTKDPIDVFCWHDHPSEMNCVCKTVSKTIKEGGITVEVISCKCFH